MNSYKILIISLLSIFFLSSCEDVIELDLENTDPQLVIEGTLDMTSQTAKVVLTETNGFYETAQPVPTENAFVELTAPDGTTYTLDEIEPGIFEVENLSVTPEDEFQLTVEANGERYEAAAITPYPATLDDLNSEEFMFPFGNNEDTSYQVFMNWTDEEAVDNFYRVRSYRNGELIPANYMILNDELLEGAVFTLPVRQETFEKGEVVTVELLSTNEGYYDYFVQLSGLAPGGPGGGATPYNPKGNFSNGALGYFGIYSTSRLEIEL